MIVASGWNTFCLKRIHHAEEIKPKLKGSIFFESAQLLWCCIQEISPMSDGLLVDPPWLDNMKHSQILFSAGLTHTSCLCCRFSVVLKHGRRTMHVRSFSRISALELALLAPHSNEVVSGLNFPLLGKVCSCGSQNLNIWKVKINAYLIWHNTI